MGLYEEVEQACEFIQSNVFLSPKIGFILGSGLGAFAEFVEDATEIPYTEIPHFNASKVSGHAGKLICGEICGIPVVVLSGRTHYYEGYSMQQVGFPVRVLASLGVTKLFITNAAGGINESFNPGDLMLISDHINLTGGNPLRGENDQRLGVRFPDVSQVHCPKMAEKIKSVAKQEQLELKSGVYVSVSGPSYESCAEIKMMRMCGADAVGMSTVPEIIVAAHAGIQVCGISVITNYAAGMASTPLSHEDVKAMGEKVSEKMCRLLEKTLLEFSC